MCRFTLVALATLAGCVPISIPQVAEHPGGKTLGVVSLIPDVMLHYHYGILAGISNSHGVSPAPLDVGLEMTQQLKDAVEARSGFKVKIIPAPDFLTSQPVRTADGAVFGTLCGASASSVPLTESTMDTLGRFAKVIA